MSKQKRPAARGRGCSPRECCAASLAGRMRTGLTGPLRIGLANLAGPGSAARTAAPAIGLGVALLSAVVLLPSYYLLRERRLTAASR